MKFGGILVFSQMNGIFTVNRCFFGLILAALALSAYNLLQRKMAKSYSRFQTATFGMFAGTLMLSIFSSMVTEALSECPLPPSGGII